MTVALVFGLLVLFQIKHFLADYPFQTEYMLGKFKKEGWFLPLLLHAATHGIFTFAITAFFTPWAPFLGLLDATIHFIMDRIKASPNLLGRFKALSGEQYAYAKNNLREIEKMQIQGKLRHSLAESPAYQDNADKLRRNTYFWWALGFDQMVHHLTDYLVIFLLLPL